jgi:membrane protein YqaA with SNARE-associated domain
MLQNQLDNLYALLEKYAHSKNKLRALFFVSFLEQSVSPIMPDVLIVPISMYKKYSAFFVANFAAISSTIGAALTYGISFFYGESVVNFFNMSDKIFQFQNTYTHNLLLAAVIASFTPIPDKIYTVFGGIFKANFPVLMVGIYIGKFIRFYIVAYLAEKFGLESKKYIKKYLRTITIFTLAIITVYIIISV